MEEVLPRVVTESGIGAGAESSPGDTPGVSSSPKRLSEPPTAGAGEILKGRAAIPNYEAQIEARTDQQTKLQNEVGETSRRIAELESSRISTGKIIKWGILAAAAVDGLVGVAAGVLAAPLTCCIVMGTLVGVVTGLVTSYALHKGNCDRQAQIELLGQLQNARGGLREANEGLIGAYGDLQTATAELAGQQGTIGEQRTTIAEQQALVAEQTTQIENLQQQNTELQQNLEAVQEARAAAERQVEEIQASSTQLQSALTDIKAKIEGNEAEIARLRQTNAEQADALQKQTNAMKAFVDQQQEMVSKLAATVQENQKCLDGMLAKVQTDGDDVQGSIEQIKTYVKNEFDAVQKELTVATTKSNEVLTSLENQTMTIESLVEAQKTVNGAILKSITRLGIMQAHIIGALTDLQTKIQKQQEEMEAAIGILQQNHEEAVGNIQQLQESYNDVQTQLEQYQKRIDDALTRAKQLGGQAGSGTDQNASKLVLNAMAEAQQLSQQAENLQTELATIGANLARAREYGKEIATTYGELQEKQRQLGTNCETLQQQNQALQRSNDELFGHAQRIGENLGVIGAGVDQAAAGISGAVAAVDGATSRWSRFGAILGAGVGGAGAAAVGAGAFAVGAAAAAGVVFIPLASIMAVSYMVGITSGYITSAKNKAKEFEDSIKSTLSTSKQRIADIGSSITRLWNRITSVNQSLNPFART